MKRPVIFFILLSLISLTIKAQQGQLSAAPPVITDPNVLDVNGNPSAFIYNATGEQEFTLDCGITSIEMIARYNDVGTTDSYIVESIPYAPVRFDLPVAGEPGEVIPVNADDTWSSILPVGADTDPSALDFCFFQNVYNQFILNTNGVVSFDINAPAAQTPAQQPLGHATWILAGGGLPMKLGLTGNTNLFSNAIFFPMHDPNPADSDATASTFAFWNIIGTAPNRKFVMAIHDYPMFSCGNPSTTQQLIFYENTNIIEVHMQDKPVCSSWNGGFAVVGIQNSARDTAFTPIGRDTDVWTADFESWRFVPDGGSVRPTFEWFENYDHATNTGTSITTNTAHTFNPTVTTTYTAEVRYIEACSGNLVIEAQDIIITLDNPLQGEIVDATPPNDPVETINLCNTGDTYTVSATAQTTIAGGTFTYEWKQITTNLVVGNTNTLVIDSSTFGATEVFEVTISLFDAASVFVCLISDSVTVTVGGPSFDYAITDYCSTTDTDPLPQNITPVGGVYTINNGGVINATTGEIDLSSSGIGTDMTGNFIITYTIGTAPDDCDDVFAITIATGDATFTYPSATVCINDGTATPDSITTSGGEFTINNGGVIDINTGEVNLTASGSGTFIINYDTTILGGACVGNEDFTLTITALDDTNFGYNSGTATPTDFCVSDLTSGLPNPLPGTSGGTYTINAPGIIDAATGVVDFDTVTGTPASNVPYTITYTTPGSCTNSDDFQITLHSDEIANFNYNPSYCLNDVNPLPTNTGTGGGAYTITGGSTGGTINATSGEVNLTASGAGDFTITYTTPGVFCPDSDTYMITINPLPVTTAPTSNLNTCDVNETGIADFDTSLFESEILNGQSNTDFTVTYEDASNIAIVMANPFTSVTQTITAIVTNNITNCFNEIDFTITVDPLPTATAPTSNLIGCDDGNGVNTASFDTSLFESEILNGQNAADFTVTYQDASDVDLTITNPYTGIAQTITAIVTNNTTGCFKEVDFIITVNPLPTATTPTSNLSACDDGTGVASFDSSLFNSEILDIQSALDFTVTYEDASDVAITMTNPFISATQVITAIVTNNTTFCEQEVDFTLTVTPLPTATVPTSNLNTCDVNETGIADFDTSLFESEILNGQSNTDFTVTYEDASNIAIVMANPFTSVTQTITAIVTNNITNCFNEIDFTITVDPLPTATAPTSNLVGCDDGNGVNTASFDTSLFESEILNGQNAADFTVTYQDASDVDLTITNPYTSIAQTITAIVTNNTTGCFKEVDFIITVNPLPTATAPTSNLSACDDGTGVASFDSSLFNSEILDIQSALDFTVTYEDASDVAITMTNPFISATQVITAIVTNNTTLCEQEVDFTLTMDPADDSTFTYPNSLYCESQTGSVFPDNITLIGGTFTVDNGGVINLNSGEFDLDSTSAGTIYQVSYTTNGPCPTTSTFDITITPEVDASFSYPIIALCINDVNPVPDSIITAGGIFTIDTIIGSGTASIDPITGIIDLTTSNAGTYEVTYTLYTSASNVCVDFKTFIIEINGLPEFELPPQAFICPTPGTDTDIIITNPAGNYTYEWFDSSNVSVATGDTLTLNDPSQVGNYTVVVTVVSTTDPSVMCISSQIVSVGMAEQAVITDVHVDDFNRPNNSIIITVEGGTGDFTYIIEYINADNQLIQITQDNNPFFENVLSGLYTVQVIDNQGCSVDIFQTDIAVLDYPLFFTPNGDAYYDTWNINNSYLIPDSKIYIFDRFGKVLAEIDPNGVGWDGIYLGKPVPATDYWFTAEYIDPNTQIPKTVKGHFSIVRKGEI